MTFLTENDIQTRPATGEIKVLGKYVIYQTNPTMNPPQLKSVDMLHSTAVLRQKVLFPKTMAIAKQPSTEKNRDFPNDSSISVSLPSSLSNDQFVLVGPRIENCNKDWPPENIVRIEDGSVNIENKTKYPITLGKDVKIIDLKKVAIEDYDHTFAKTNNNHNDQISHNTHDSFSNLEEIAIKNASEIDVSRAPLKLQQKLKDAHLLYADVFAPDLSTGYNGFSGQHLVRLQFADENRPRMSKCHVPSWCGKNDDVKQKKMDDLEKQGVLLDPYKENVQIKLISPSFLRTKARVKGKELNECDISDIRWIISPCQLNPYLRQLHTNNTSKEDLFIFKSEKPHCIEFDLFEGYFQNHISRKDWGYLAVETPYKGLRVLTRSGQGLLNQEIEMAQLLTKVLGSEIQKKNVIIQADDGQVGGKTEEEAVENWISVLKLCYENNIKINHKKIKILPEVSMIHGWEFKKGYIQPSQHRQLAILDVKKPSTIGELRTYVGVYKTFFPAMKGLSNIMAPFDKLCGGQDSKTKISWTDELIKSFQESQQLAQTNIHKLALPNPSEQLFIVPDSCSRPPATGFILFVSRYQQDKTKTVAEPVMFVSWRMGPWKLF